MFSDLVKLLYILINQSSKSKLNSASYLYIPDCEKLVPAKPDRLFIFILCKFYYGISSSELSSSEED